MLLIIIYKIETTKEINIKNRTFYFYNDINLYEFDESKIKVEKKALMT